MVKGATIRRNAVINTFSIAIPVVVAVFAIPRIISTIGTSRFGILSLCWIVIGYSGLFDLGLGRALTKFVAERVETGETRELPSLVLTSLVLMGAFGTVAAILLASCGPLLIGRAIQVPVQLISETIWSIYVVSSALPVVVLTAGLRGIMEATQRFDLAGGLKAALGIFNLLSPILVLPFTTNLSIILLVLVIGRIAALLAHLFLCVRILPELRNRPRFNGHIAKHLLKFGISSTISSIIAPLIMALDRFVVGARMSVTAVSYYASPYEITSRLALFPNSLVGVLFPTFSATLAFEESRTEFLFKRAARMMMALMFPTVLAAVMFAHFGLSIWLGIDFAQKSTVVLQLLAIGAFSNAFGLLAFTLVQGAGRPDLCAKLNLAELCFYVPSLWYATSRYGLEGAAAVSLIRVVLDTVFLLICCLRVLPSLKSGMAEVFSMLGGGIAFLIAAAFSRFTPSIRFLLFVALAFSTLFTCHYLFSCLRRNPTRPASSNVEIEF